MRALLDTNVVLDSLLARPPWHVEADDVRSCLSAFQILPIEAQGDLVAIYDWYVA